MRLYKNGVELPNIGLNADFTGEAYLVEGTLSNGVVITLDDDRRDLIALKTSTNEFDDLVTELIEYDFEANGVGQVRSWEPVTRICWNDLTESEKSDFYYIAHESDKEDYRLFRFGDGVYDLARFMVCESREFLSYYGLGYFLLSVVLRQDPEDQDELQVGYLMS